MPVTNNYTNADVLSLNNNALVAFYNNVLVGVLQPGDHTINLEIDTDVITASLHGSSPIASYKKGAMLTVTLAVQGLNKHRLRNIFARTYGLITGGTATADTTPDVGSMEILGNVGVMAQEALVLYPIYTNKDGTSFVDDTSNKNAFVFPYATCVNGLEFALTTEDIIKYDLEFRAHVDVDNEGRMAIHDDGVSSDGTHSLV